MNQFSISFLLVAFSLLTVSGCGQDVNPSDDTIAGLVLPSQGQHFISRVLADVYVLGHTFRVAAPDTQFGMVNTRVRTIQKLWILFSDESINSSEDLVAVVVGRHGQSGWNVEVAPDKGGIHQGNSRLALGLTVLGRQDADVLANNLHRLGFFDSVVAVIASPLYRAEETLTRVLAWLGENFRALFGIERQLFLKDRTDGLQIAESLVELGTPAFDGKTLSGIHRELGGDWLDVARLPRRKIQLQKLLSDSPFDESELKRLIEARRQLNDEVSSLIAPAGLNLADLRPLLDTSGDPSPELLERLTAADVDVSEFLQAFKKRSEVGEPVGKRFYDLWHSNQFLGRTPPNPVTGQQQGERGIDALARINRAVADIVAQLSPGESALAISHMGVIRLLMARFSNLELDPETGLKNGLKNGEAVVLLFKRLGDGTLLPVSAIDKATGKPAPIILGSNGLRVGALSQVARQL